jgi:hypothetical protein
MTSVEYFHRRIIGIKGPGGTIGCGYRVLKYDEPPNSLVERVRLLQQIDLKAESCGFFCTLWCCQVTVVPTMSRRSLAALPTIGLVEIFVGGNMLVRL